MTLGWLSTTIGTPGGPPHPGNRGLGRDDLAAMLQVFIDTNVYLNFFGFTRDDLEELRKLRVAINHRELKLWITEQSLDELRRNREAKLAESLQALRKLKPTGGSPQVARQLPAFKEFSAARREFDKMINALADQLLEQIVGRNLAADHVLAELMGPAETIRVTEAILDRARRRVDLGNPPGKKGSLGDAVSWECLLDQCPGGQDLYLVTEDSDFVSKVEADKIAAYLADEWREAKSSDVHLYQRISGLFQDKFPQIELASEFEKELRVRKLIESRSFTLTHTAISELAGYSDYSDAQVRELVEAATSNSQIRWIAHDEDVNEFFRNLIDTHGDIFAPDDLAHFERVFGPEAEPDAFEDEDIPF